MGGVGPGQPVGRYEVVQAERVQADLEGTEVQVAVGALVSAAGRGLCEDGRGAVPARLDQHRLGQLEVEVGRGLRGLVGHVRGVALGATPFVPTGARHKTHTHTHLHLCSSGFIKAALGSTYA